MSNQQAAELALQDIANEIIPTLISGMKKKEAQEKKQPAAMKKVKKKIKKPMLRDDLDPNISESDNRRPISLTKLMGKPSASEQKFNEMMARKLEKPKKRRR